MSGSGNKFSDIIDDEQLTHTQLSEQLVDDLGDKNLMRYSQVVEREFLSPLSINEVQLLMDSHYSYVYSCWLCRFFSNHLLHVTQRNNINGQPSEGSAVERQTSS